MQNVSLAAGGWKLFEGIASLVVGRMPTEMATIVLGVFQEAYLFYLINNAESSAPATGSSTQQAQGLVAASALITLITAQSKLSGKDDSSAVEIDNTLGDDAPIEIVVDDDTAAYYGYY